MKKKYLLLALILTLNISSLGAQRDDLDFISKLYQQKNFDMALIESKNFLNKYPNSKYNREIIDRIAKVYFLQKNYQKSITYFKILLLDEKISKKDKNEINYYLAQAYAGSGDSKFTDMSINNIDKKSDYFEKAIFKSATIYLDKERYLEAKKLYGLLVNSESPYANEALLNLSVLAYNQEEYLSATGYIKRYLENNGDKNNIFMNYLLGSSFYKLNKIDDSIKYFTIAVNQKDKNIYTEKSLLSLINIYANNNHMNLAYETMQKLNNQTDLNEGFRIIGDAYLKQKKYLNAFEEFKKITNKSPQILFNQGYSLFKLDRFNEAKKYFKQLDNTTYHREALYYLFAINYNSNNFNSVVNMRKFLTKVNFSSEDKKSIELMVANSAYKLKKYEVAREYFIRTNGNKPNLKNLYRLIVIDGNLEDLKDLNIRFNDYNNNFSEDTKYKKNIYLIVGELYYKNKMLDEAKNLYENYLKTNSDNEILNNLITILLDKQEYSTMIEYLKNAPDTTETKYLNAVALMGVGEYSKAENYLNEVIANKDVNDITLEKARLNKIRNNFLQGNYNDTIKFGEDYINNYPKNENLDIVYNKMAIAYFRLQKFEKSREIYTKLMEFPQHKEYALFQIGDSYYAEKDYKNANQYYSKLMKEYPDGKYTQNSNYWYLHSLSNMKDYKTFETEKNIFLTKYPNSDMKENIYILSSEIYEKNNDDAKLLTTYEKLYHDSKDPQIKEDTLGKIIALSIKHNDLEKALALTNEMQNINNSIYYKALIFEKSGKTDELIPVYEKLFNTEEYRDFAGMKLATYYFKNKNYEKAKFYYEALDELTNSLYKDLVIYQLADIAEKQGDISLAFRNYTKSYTVYDGKYNSISKFKAAQMAEKLNKITTAINLYKELNKLPNFEYKNFVLEKLIYFSLKANDLKTGKKYYDQLKIRDKKLANKYNEFFEVKKVINNENNQINKED